MSKKANASASVAKFQARVVYGFENKLEVVLLGNPIEGKIEKGMSAHVQIGQSAQVGNWEIVEIQKMDFINESEHHNFLGLVIRCADVSAYKLLQSLRVYDEILLIQ